MPLFDRLDIQQVEESIPQEDVQRARLLIDSLRKQSLIAKSYSLNAWSSSFHQLRTKDGIDAKTIDQVLRWYVKHLNDEYVPQARSARSFRTKFDRIQQAMLKQTESTADYVDKLKSMTPLKDLENQPDRRPYLVAAKLLNLKWPMGASAYVPSVVQQSFTNLDSFRSSVKRFAPRFNPDTKLYEYKKRPSRPIQYFANRVLHLTNPTEYIEAYYQRIFDSVFNWPGWVGELHPVDVYSPRFQKSMLSWAIDHGSSPDYWYQLWHLIKEKL